MAPTARTSCITDPHGMISPRYSRFDNRFANRDSAGLMSFGSR
jgi:hypothetical protein